MKNQLELFLSVYFSDSESIEKLIRSEEDLIFTVNIPKAYFQWQSNQFSISAIEIFQMTLDLWDDLKNVKKLKNDSRISPEKNYLSALRALKIITQKFPDFKTKTIAYENYIGLSFAFLPGDEYFNTDEFEEYLNEGYKKIDLELINAGVRKNTESVRHLLDLGANPMIDPADNTHDSLILTILSDAEAFHFNQYLGYHRQLIDLAKESFKEEDIYPMLSCLFTTASSSKLYKLISGFSA